MKFHKPLGYTRGELWAEERFEGGGFVEGEGPLGDGFGSGVGELEMGPEGEGPEATFGDFGEEDTAAFLEAFVAGFLDFRLKSRLYSRLDTRFDSAFDLLEDEGAEYSVL
jgi:hypothetical protein